MSAYQTPQEVGGPGTARRSSIEQAGGRGGCFERTGVGTRGSVGAAKGACDLLPACDLDELEMGRALKILKHPRFSGSEWTFGVCFLGDLLLKFLPTLHSRT